MPCPTGRRCLALLALASGLLWIGFASAQKNDDAGFVALFNGKDLTGFKMIGTKADTFTVVDGELRCSGKPNGYFHTVKGYKNYILEFDVKYVRPAGLEDDSKFNGNSGFLIHITGEQKVWPKCVEVQGMNKDMGNIFSIGGAPKGTFKKDAAAQKKAIKKVGEWNKVRIDCNDGSITCTINGTKVADGSSDLKEGPIGWQSEGAEIHFRNLKIKEAK